MQGTCRLLCAGLLAGFVARPVALGAEWEVRATFDHISVLLTTSQTLSAAARESMITEAAAIWRQHGVIIEWLAPTVVRSPAPNLMRVLIVPKRPVVDSGAAPVAVGELVRPTDGHPIALISIESARHLISSVRGRAGYELIAVDQRRLGIVLGRALAHEIGHYLLDTHTHARTGLMRPQFNALEFTDLRDGTFALDQAAEAWLRTRNAERFAY
jgi:hypothetical protein